MLYKNEPSTYDEKCYLKIKNLFSTELKKTNQRCVKMYHNKYDQERNFSVSIHPEIEKNRICTEYSIKTVQKELAFIKKSIQPPLKKAAAIIEYTEGLINTPFNNLFMIIFKGKLAKHALATMKNIYSNAEQQTITFLNHKAPTNTDVITGFCTNK